MLAARAAVGFHRERPDRSIVLGIRELEARPGENSAAVQEVAQGEGLEQFLGAGGAIGCDFQTKTKQAVGIQIGVEQVRAQIENRLPLGALAGQRPALTLEQGLQGAEARGAAILVHVEGVLDRPRSGRPSIRRQRTSVGPVKAGWGLGSQPFQQVGRLKRCCQLEVDDLAKALDPQTECQCKGDFGSGTVTLSEGDVDLRARSNRSRQRKRS